MSEVNETGSPRDDLERVFRSVAPASAKIDPIAAAWDAGRRVARREVRIWKAAAAFTLLAGMGTGWISHVNYPPDAVPKLSGTWVELPAQPPRRSDASISPVSNQSLLMLQRVIQEKGVEGLPQPAMSPARSIKGDDSI